MDDKMVVRVTVEFDDGSIIEASGDEAAKHQRHGSSLAIFAALHNRNPFDTDPIKWVTIKQPRENHNG